MKNRELTSQEVKQVSGRTGRRGIYNEGFVASTRDTQDFIKSRLEVKDEEIKKAVYEERIKVSKVINELLVMI